MDRPICSRGGGQDGAESVYTGMFTPGSEQIQAIIKHGSTVLFGETRLIYRITKETEHIYDLGKLGVKVLL